MAVDHHHHRLAETPFLQPSKPILYCTHYTLSTPHQPEKSIKNQTIDKNNNYKVVKIQFFFFVDVKIKTNKSTYNYRASEMVSKRCTPTTIIKGLFGNRITKKINLWPHSLKISDGYFPNNKKG